MLLLGDVVVGGFVFCFVLFCFVFLNSLVGRSSSSSSSIWSVSYKWF